MHNLQGSSSRFYVDTEWGQVHGRASGSSADPAVVFIHQSPLSSAIYEPMLGLLSEYGFHAIALDTPGFGMSDQANPHWKISDLAKGFWTVIDGLGLREINIVGQHTGATIGVEAFKQQPDRILSLILQGLPLYDDEEREEKKRSWAPGYEPTANGDHLIHIWKRVFELYPTISVEDANRQVLEYLSIGPDYGTAYRAVFDYEVDLESLQSAPLRLVHGENDLLERMSDRYRTVFPEAPYETIPGGTDFVSIEFPREFAAAIARHAVKSHEAMNS